METQAARISQSEGDRMLWVGDMKISTVTVKDGAAMRKAGRYGQQHGRCCEKQQGLQRPLAKKAEAEEVTVKA